MGLGRRVGRLDDLVHGANESTAVERRGHPASLGQPEIADQGQGRIVSARMELVDTGQDRRVEPIRVDSGVGQRREDPPERRAVSGVMGGDRPFEFTPEWVARMNDLMVEGKRELVFGGGKLPRVPKVPPMPAGYTFINRLQWGFYSVLTRLRAEFSWYALLPPDIRGANEV